MSFKSLLMYVLSSGYALPARLYRLIWECL